MNVRFCLYVPGMEIPEWFTYKSWGTQSMSVALPTNWFTPTFRGFTVCVVFDKWIPLILGPFNIHKVHGLKNMIWLNLKRYDGLRQKISTSFGPIGSENPGGLGNTLITHVPFGSRWQLEDDLDYYRNNAFQLEFSACDHYQKDMVKGLGVRLVYEN